MNVDVLHIWKELSGVDDVLVVEEQEEVVGGCMYVDMALLTGEEGEGGEVDDGGCGGDSDDEDDEVNVTGTYLSARSSCNCIRSISMLTRVNGPMVVAAS